MQYRYHFEGFEGARRVQSMMIDFPELRFVLNSKPIVQIDFFVGKNPCNWIKIFVWNERYTEETLIRMDDTETKIIVAPESEAFFDLMHNDFTSDFESAHKIHVEDGLYGFADEVEQVLFSVIDYKKCLFTREKFEEIYPIKGLRFWERNGKRLWMPKERANNDAN